MNLITTWTDCVLLRDDAGTRLVDGPKELRDFLEGDSMEDAACYGDTLPKRAGTIVADVEYWFQQGYHEGEEADAESDHDLRLSNVRPAHPRAWLAALRAIGEHGADSGSYARQALEGG